MLPVKIILKTAIKTKNNQLRGFIPVPEKNWPLNIRYFGIFLTRFLTRGSYYWVSNITLWKVVSNVHFQQGCGAGAGLFGRSRSCTNLAGSGQGVDILTIFLEISISNSRKISKFFTKSINFKLTQPFILPKIYLYDPKKRHIWTQITSI